MIEKEKRIKGPDLDFSKEALDRVDREIKKRAKIDKENDESGPWADQYD